MAQELTVEGQVRRWVDRVLSQSDGALAATSLAVLWNGTSVGEGVTSGRRYAAAFAALLQEPLAGLGGSDPDLDFLLAAHATLGKLADDLWDGTCRRLRRRSGSSVLLGWRHGTAGSAVIKIEG